MLDRKFTRGRMTPATRCRIKPSRAAQGWQPARRVSAAPGFVAAAPPLRADFQIKHLVALMNCSIHTPTPTLCGTTGPRELDSGRARSLTRDVEIVSRGVLLWLEHEGGYPLAPPTPLRNEPLRRVTLGGREDPTHAMTCHAWLQLNDQAQSAMPIEAAVRLVPQRGQGPCGGDPAPHGSSLPPHDSPPSRQQHTTFQ